MTLIETPRLRLREMTVDDAAFILALLNEPTFLQYIGDRGVRSLAQAADFIETRYRRSYREHGYGLYVASDAARGVPIGMCGFVRREALTHPDLGFALLPAAAGHGLAYEAAAATIAYGRSALGMTRILAVVQHDNLRSQRLLARLGFVRDGDVTLAPGEAPLQLHASDARAAVTPP